MRRVAGPAQLLSTAAAAAAVAGGIMGSILAAAGAHALVPDDPSPAWRVGPIRYILTADEDAAYRTLQSDEERRAFIEQFWSALDPTPGTPENERRDEFWRRVMESVNLYVETLPGWKTDRGKAHILMGPPDRRLRQGSQEVWVYDALPRPDAPPEVRVTFTRMSEGAYRMHHGDLAYMDPGAGVAGIPAGETYLAAPGTDLSRMIKSRIRMTDFPAADVRADYFVQTLDFRWRLHFYRGEEGETRASLTVSLPVSQFEGSASARLGPDVSVSASFIDPRRKRPEKRASGTMQPVAANFPPPGRQLLFQTAWSLPPGAYDATLMVADRRSRRGATAQGRVEVPDFRRGLSLSSIVLGRIQSDGGPPSEGHVMTVPDPTATFTAGEGMAIACQIYNARHRDGRASLAVTYSFFQRRGDEVRQVGRPVSRPAQASESPAFEVTLRDWPEGSYRVQVTVTDDVARKQATAEEDFQVRPASSP